MMMPKLKSKVTPNPVTEESFFLEDNVLTTDWMNMPEASAAEEPVVDGQLAVDVYETAKDIVVKAPVAGVDGDDIDITVTDEMVIIRGERKNVKEVDMGSYHAQECYWGSFSRTVSLPQKGLSCCWPWPLSSSTSFSESFTKASSIPSRFYPACPRRDLAHS